MVVAVNEIAKKPKLISDLQDVLYIKDKRKDELKSIVIPAQFLDRIKDKLEDIEYELWLQRNEEGLAEDLGDLFDAAIEEIGEKL
ncbi:MAG: hypothetical protein JXQ76_10805 [Campylobacterales bacterium]|nr:hypothetical protein [Campylobacterales bacterium]